MFIAKVLLVDDHTMFRQGLKALLASEPDIEVVGEANNGREALRQMPTLRPDIVLMDISMPGLNGIEATRQIRQAYPAVKVVVLSMHTDEEYIFQLLRAGARGYVLKQSDTSEVLTAIRAAATDGLFLSPSISQVIIDDYVSRADIRGQEAELHPLTSREREVLQLLAEGQSNQEIAELLSISVKTVETHRTNTMNKLGLTDKTDLVKYALRKGWISLD